MCAVVFVRQTFVVERVYRHGRERKIERKRERKRERETEREREIENVKTVLN